MQIVMAQSLNQRIPFIYQEMDFTLTFRAFEGNLYASVTADGEPIVTGRRVFADADIFWNEHLKARFGNLVLHSKYNSSVLDTTAYNNSVYLEYTPPSE